MRIIFHIDDAQVQNAVQRLIGDGADLSPVMRDIGELILTSARNRFDSQTSPDNTPWAPLSNATLARKHRNRDKILTQDGVLRESIAPRSGRDYVEIGTPTIYANTHQFGAKKGAFGKTRRGAPIPWGDIPARSFFGFSDDDQANIQKILTDYIAARWA